MVRYIALHATKARSAGWKPKLPVNSAKTRLACSLVHTRTKTDLEW